MRKKIEIFIGGSTDINMSKDYYEIAMELGNAINERDYNIIFDGCHGLPYVVFNELEDKFRATVYYNEKFAMPKIPYTQIRRHRSQSDTTRAFIKESDAMIFMKGGMGTIAEVAHAIDSKKNKEIYSPIIILNINNEWDELINLLDNYNLQDLYCVADNIEDALNYLETELYKEGSYFRKVWIDSGDFIERKDPILFYSTLKRNK